MREVAGDRRNGGLGLGHDRRRELPAVGDCTTQRLLSAFRRASFVGSLSVSMLDRRTFRRLVEVPGWPDVLVFVLGCIRNLLASVRPRAA